MKCLINGIVCEKDWLAQNGDCDVEPRTACRIAMYEQLLSDLAALQKIADFAFDIHTRDPVNVKKKWGVCGVKAEEKLCEMIEAQLPEEDK